MFRTSLNNGNGAFNLKRVINIKWLKLEFNYGGCKFVGNKFDGLEERYLDMLTDQLWHDWETFIRNIAVLFWFKNYNDHHAELSYFINADYKGWSSHDKLFLKDDRTFISSVLRWAVDREGFPSINQRIDYHFFLSKLNKNFIHFADNTLFTKTSMSSKII